MNEFFSPCLVCYSFVPFIIFSLFYITCLSDDKVIENKSTRLKAILSAQGILLQILRP